MIRNFHDHMMRGALRGRPIILNFSPEIDDALRRAAAEEGKSVESALEDEIAARVRVNLVRGNYA